jgi:hypothetical protein
VNENYHGLITKTKLQTFFEGFSIIGGNKRSEERWIWDGYRERSDMNRYTK